MMAMKEEEMMLMVWRIFQLPLQPLPHLLLSVVGKPALLRMRKHFQLGLVTVLLQLPCSLHIGHLPSLMIDAVVSSSYLGG